MYTIHEASCREQEALLNPQGCNVDSSIFCKLSPKATEVLIASAALARHGKVARFSEKEKHRHREKVWSFQRKKTFFSGYGFFFFPVGRQLIPHGWESFTPFKLMIQKKGSNEFLMLPNCLPYEGKMNFRPYQWAKCCLKSLSKVFQKSPTLSPGMLESQASTKHCEEALDDRNQRAHLLEPELFESCLFFNVEQCFSTSGTGTTYW